MTYAEREAIERLNRETLKAKGIIYGGDVSESAGIGCAKTLSELRKIKLARHVGFMNLLLVIRRSHRELRYPLLD